MGLLEESAELRKRTAIALAESKSRSAQIASDMMECTSSNSVDTCSRLEEPEEVFDGKTATIVYG
jgi:hypothetical protein